MPPPPAGMAALGKGAFTPGQMVWFDVLGIVTGVVAVRIYAAIRPRYGAGVKTAIYAGIAVWIVKLSPAECRIHVCSAPVPTAYDAVYNAWRNRGDRHRDDRGRGPVQGDSVSGNNVDDGSEGSVGT